MKIIKISKKLLKILYYKQNLTRQDIANKLNTSLSTIKRKFKKYSIFKIGKHPICLDCSKPLRNIYAIRCAKHSAIQNEKELIKLNIKTREVKK